MADENLTAEEQIVEDYSTYDTNYFTGSQVSLFLGPVWIEDFVGIRWQMRNSKQPVYGYNELYSDMDLPGKFLIEGTLTVNFRETDYLQRLILQIQQAIENQPDRIDDIIESQKGKFRTRIENRLLEQTSGDESKVAALIEQARNRLNVLVNELSNQEENIFNFELTVVAGNYRSGANDSAIKIFEGFTISDEIGQSEPDDTPLYTTYRWYARKSRSRTTNPQTLADENLAPIDVKRMLDEICDKLVNGFGLENKKTILDLLTEQNQERPQKLSLFDIAGSESYSKEKKRGLIDIPFIEFINTTLDNKNKDLTKDIQTIDKIGHTGLVKVGTNNYGYNANLNKYIIRYSCPIIFELEQPVYEFEIDNLTNTVLYDSPSKPINKSGIKLNQSIATGNVFKYPILLDNTSGKLQHIDHEKMGYEGNGFEIVGQIMPSPPSSRGSGIPIRSFMPDETWNIKTVNPKTYSSFTNSFLSYSEPITILKQRKNYFKNTSKDETLEKVEEIVSMPLYTASFFDWTKMLGYDEESKQYKIVKPLPLYYVNRYIEETHILENEESIKTGDFSSFETDELKGFIGTEGENFIIIPLDTYSYVGTILDFIGTPEQEDFVYNNYNLRSLIKEKYTKDLLGEQPFSNSQKCIHIFPVVINIEDYISQVDNITNFGDDTEKILKLNEKRNEWKNTPGQALQDMLKILADKSKNINSIVNIFSDIHYDYLFKNTSGMSVAGITKEIEFSMINKVEPDQELKSSEEVFNYYVEYYCVVSTIPKIPNKPKTNTETKTKYSLVNFKGLGNIIESTQEESSNEGRLSDYQQGFSKVKPLTYNAPVAPVVEYEIFVRSDIKHYDVQDSIIDTFLNSLSGIFGDTLSEKFNWKNIITYMEEFEEYVGQLIDPEQSGFKEWMGYFKQTFIGLIEPVIKTISYNSPLVSTFGEEEKVVVKNINNLVAFNREVYLNINLRNIAKELFKYFNNSEFPIGNPSANSEVTTRKAELNNTRLESNSNSTDKTLLTATKDFSSFVTRIEKDFSNSGTVTKAGNNRLIDRISQSRELTIGNEESFIIFVAESLRKKIAKFNVTENTSIEVSNKRFGVDPTAKIISSTPLFKDPTKLDFIYVKLKNTEPSASAIVKNGANIVEDEPSVIGYDIGESFDDSEIEFP